MTDTGQDPHSKAAAAVHEGRPVEAQYTRQGRRGTRILWVLLIGVALAAVALFGSWLSKSGDLQAANVNAGREPADAASFSQDEPSAKQTDTPSHPAPQSGQTGGAGTAPQQ
jgi:flagellar basal body-associated protein FliL